MASNHSLPFFADLSTLPAPLPSAEAITASQDILQDYTGRRVVRVSTHFLVKYGLAVNLSEGEIMQFVKQSTSIPVPTVYSLYSRHKQGHKKPTNFIVMEYIPSENLSSRWVSLDPTAKLLIADQLCDYFIQLRNIPSPGYFGMVGRRPFDNSMFWTADSGDMSGPEVPAGPFDTEEQMLDAMVQKYKYNNSAYRKSEYYSRVLPTVIRDHAPVFTHADFQRKNVLVKDDGRLVLIDWETAGWYPSFWEYAVALYACRWDDDWHEWVVKILDEYPNEYPWMVMMFQELWS